MDDVAALLNRLRELEPEVHVYGPATDDSIRHLEAAFGHPMPPSYRTFLARFGALSILDRTYSGIIDGKIEQGRGWTLTDTKHAREWCKLPEHYLVVQPDEDGFKCLDFSRTWTDGEHPVIYHMPFRQTPFHEMGTNFRVWLTERLQTQIEIWEEDRESDPASDDL